MFLTTNGVVCDESRLCTRIAILIQIHPSVGIRQSGRIDAVLQRSGLQESDTVSYPIHTKHLYIHPRGWVEGIIKIQCGHGPADTEPISAA